LILALFAATGLIAINAQVSGNYQYGNQQNAQSSNRMPVSKAVIMNNNEIQITINGLFNIVADNYVAVFNVMQVGETMEVADQMMNSRISSFVQKLKWIGVDTSEIRVDVISFVPKYDIQVENRLFSKTYNEIPAGFELQKNVAVRYNKSGKLDQIITAAASAEIYDIVKVDYFIGSIEKSLDTLRQKCFLEIKGRVKELETIGFRLDTLKKVMSDDFSTVYPQTRYYSYQAFSRPSLGAAKRKSSPTYNESYKAVSKFYNPLEYDRYDIVINPVIIEPVVQVSYTVAVKYFMKSDEKPNSNYYILTPTGDIRQFNPK
jgi:uncharacterized protein YggE